MKKLFLVFIILMFPFTIVQGQEDYQKLAGFVDLSEIDEFRDSDETVEVFITKPLLKLVSSITADEDKALSDLLSNLALIRVDKFSLEKKQNEKVKEVISKISKKLSKEKWSRIVRVKESNELVEIFIKNENEHVAGLLIMTLENNKEAVFVNIVGRIDMDQLGKLSRKFDIPELGSFEKRRDKLKK